MPGEGANWDEKSGFFVDSTGLFGLICCIRIGCDPQSDLFLGRIDA